MTGKLTGRLDIGGWSIPDGDLYKRSEMMLYLKQIGVKYQEIGLRYVITAEGVRKSLAKRKAVIEQYLESKDAEERRLGLK